MALARSAWWRPTLAAAVLGVLFCFVTLRLTLGPAGMTPPLTIPAGLLSFVLLRALARLVPGPGLTPQENAVAQTMATACYKLVGYAGFGSYLTALSYQVYLQTGGIPRGQPGFDASGVVDPDLHLVYPYLACIAFGGIFVLLGLRRLLIISWRLPFPSGAASGSMINSLHDAAAVRHQPGDRAALPLVASSAAPAAASGAGELEAADADVLVSSSASQPDVDMGLVAAPAPSAAAAAAAAAAAPADTKVKVLAWTALASILFDAFKWLFQGPTYACGFATWPTFGTRAAQWTWRFDFQQQYIGSGMLVPPLIAWSMLLGAIISWGLMWPLLALKEGSWFPPGLNAYSDMRGLAGYKICLSVALLLGEGCFVVVKAALLGLFQARAYYHQRQHRRRQEQLPHHSHRRSDSGSSSPVAPHSLAAADCQAWTAKEPQQAGVSSCHADAAAVADVRLQVAGQRKQHACPPQLTQRRSFQQQHTQAPAEAANQRGSEAAGITGSCSSGCRAGGAAADEAEDEGAFDQGTRGGFAGAVFHETSHERKLREAVFTADAIPGWLGPAGFVALAALGTACIPHIYPAARWYMVLVAFLCGPPVALINAYGTGITDADNSANFATLAMFLFSSWAASTGGNGVVAGCVVSGVLMMFTVSAAVLMQDLRTGYVTCTPPRAMLWAQVAGAAMGVVIAPAAFALIWSGGQVGVPEGPYPAPFAAVTRGIVTLGAQGASALPRHCGSLAAALFVAAFGLCMLRELLPPRCGRFVPSPMAMAFPFFVPASIALDFWLGSVIVLVWEHRRPAAAAAYAPLAGAGLVVGDGLWAIPAAVLAVANVLPPMCMKFE